MLSTLFILFNLHILWGEQYYYLHLSALSYSLPPGPILALFCLAWALVQFHEGVVINLVLTAHRGIVWGQEWKRLGPTAKILRGTPGWQSHKEGCRRAGHQDPRWWFGKEWLWDIGGSCPGRWSGVPGDHGRSSPEWVLWILLPSQANGLTWSQLLLLLSWMSEWRVGAKKQPLTMATLLLGSITLLLSSDSFPRTPFLSQVPKVILYSCSLRNVAAPGLPSVITGRS